MEDKVRNGNKIVCKFCNSDMTYYTWRAGERYVVCTKCGKAERYPPTVDERKEWE
jgi:RNase P subunit RPR2